MTPRIRLDRLTFVGPQQTAAAVRLDDHLTVVCGASDTGKSFIVEAIDFALGRSTAPRDIPQRVGYDRVRLQLGTDDGEHTWTLERSMAGGGYRLAEGVVRDDESITADDTLSDKHKHATTDNISGWLLQKIGLLGSRVQRNKSGETNSLSFRNLGKLLIVDEEDIIAQRSPFLSGQYTTATIEFAVLKLFLTGIDDSGMVNSKAIKSSEQDNSIKIGLLEEMIHSLEQEIQDVAPEAELRDQLSRLDATIAEIGQHVAAARSDANQALLRRQDLARNLDAARSRVSEIDELSERFNLLHAHYQTDIQRLRAIQEGGSLFVHLDAETCPLCGAAPEAQAHAGSCDADVPAIVNAAQSEISKIESLIEELNETRSQLGSESEKLGLLVEQVKPELEQAGSDIEEILNPRLGEITGQFQELADAKADAHGQLQLYSRLKILLERRDDLISEEEGPADDAIQADLSQFILDEFSQEVHHTLQAWNFPNAERLHFDLKTKDFVLDGKPRASFGKGFRAITHAAVTLSLMRYCFDRGLPHPGFVLLDSPLLAYWKPEDDSDSLKLAGSDLKERFYSYLANKEARGQVIIVENEHPVEENSIHSIVFTRNPSEGRFGLFPV